MQKFFDSKELLIKDWLNNIAIHCVHDQYPNLKSDVENELAKFEKKDGLKDMETIGNC
jgi:hypothetical protein